MTQTELAVTYPGYEADRTWRRLVAPGDYVNPIPKPRYHLVVIGAGPAGLVTAIAGAGLGARVALIEKQAMGGDCLNVGCVPSKSLLEFSARPGADFDSAFAWMRRVRAEIAAHDSVERYTRSGVDVFLGAARLLDDSTVAVGDVTLAARRIVIATGARPALPPIEGLAEARPLTNETVFDLDDKPHRLAILGAGPIGCELAQVFARLGSDVHLFEAADRILVNEAEEAAAAVAASLQDQGVSLHTGAAVTAIERRGSSVTVVTGDTRQSADRLLVAAGRRPNSDGLNLAAARIGTDDAERIVVDRYLRTTNRRIFAAGDVCAPFQFTHNADAHARIVVQNALFLPTATTTKLVVPRCTYTDPEVAQVGPTRAELEREGVSFEALRVDYRDLDRGRAGGDHSGFVEVLVAGKRILGATVVGRDAGEQIAPVCLAMSNGLGLGAFGRAVLPYPTRAEALKRLADQYNRRKLTPRTQGWFERWFRWIG